jgi:Pyruvate/2-oxoacid:ferredoxin oxidoreductase delta subunit
MIRHLFALADYDYCKVCGWWVKDCGHPQS